ncbi:MAG: alcohol dehydrogenase, partial [Lentisphaerae bacterium]
VDVNEYRLQLAAEKGLVDEALKADGQTLDKIRALTGGKGVERAIDCSANATARHLCIQATRKWGRICFIGEGGDVHFHPSEDIIHDQKTIYGSWVTSIWLMEDLVERLVRWNIHPADLITHRFPLDQVAEAYALMASGNCGKVAIVFDEELTSS